VQSINTENREEIEANAKVIGGRTLLEALNEMVLNV
jgi:hypothetical protein